MPLPKPDCHGLKTLNKIKRYAKSAFFQISQTLPERHFIGIGTHFYRSWSSIFAFSLLDVTISQRAVVVTTSAHLVQKRQ
jgi:hypothetical protein